MKSTVRIMQVYGKVFSDSKQITPIEYKTVQKYQSSETCKRFIPSYSKSVYFSGDSINSPFLSNRKFNLIMRYL